MSVEFGKLIASILLIMANAFFVAAEYALIGARKGHFENLARKGNRTAKLVVEALENMAPTVAGVQVYITMVGLAIGIVAEPFLSDMIRDALGFVLSAETLRKFGTLISVFSVAVITYVTVVVGELVPKYVTLRRPDDIAMLTIRPLKFCVAFLKPLVWLVQRSGSALAGKGAVTDSDVVSRDELMMLVRSGTNAGTFDKGHGEFVSRALRLDILSAHDIMIHRIDIKWLDSKLDRDELLRRIRKMPYNRFPVCRGDIDDLVGVVYIHDILRHIDDPEFNLEAIARPPVAVPENLSLDRLVEIMREHKTQMVIVMDEYGGTSGLITLEDIIEEVFGELEDSLESERPSIRINATGRVSARAELRFDELVSRLGIDYETSITETLATLVIDELERVPRTGDEVETEIGKIRVENMARSRITRVSIDLKPEFEAQASL
jgi:CBS domain containing-hemolysin-like protein